MSFAPDYIQFYPTLRCNLSCKFCFNKSIPFCDDITLQGFKDMINRLSKLNINIIDIMGGEPTLHLDIIPIVEYARNKGFCINLSSNGTDCRTLAEIIKRFKNVNVGLSVNDRATSKRLKSFIMTYRPIVKMVFMDKPDMILMDEILISRANRFYLLYPDVMRTKDIKRFIPFYLFLESVQRMSKLHIIDVIYCSGFIPDTINYPSLSKVRCPAGTTKLGLMPDGSVYPCNLFFGMEEFRLGNLLYDSFKKIWNHKRLNFFRTFTGNKCPQTACILHNDCHGGCPAHSFVHYGKLSSPEPRCNLLLL